MYTYYSEVKKIIPRILTIFAEDTYFGWGRHHTEYEPDISRVDGARELKLSFSKLKLF